MRELERKDDWRYASYLLPEEEPNLRERVPDGIQARMLLAGLADRRVRLTDGRELGTVVELATMPFTPETRKSLGLPVKKTRALPGVAYLAVVWDEGVSLDAVGKAGIEVTSEGFTLAGYRRPLGKSRRTPSAEGAFLR